MAKEKIKNISVDLTVAIIFAVIGAVVTSHLWHTYGNQSLAFGASNDTLAYADNSQFTSDAPGGDLTAANDTSSDPLAGCGCPGCCAVSVL